MSTHIFPYRYFASGVSLDGTVDLQGHRGARGKRPENTIPAFVYCIDQEMTTIELDTHITADRQVIICHDTRINPAICLTGDGRPAPAVPIREMTVAELKQLDCGAVAHTDFPEQIPVAGTRLSTLPEFFDFIRAGERHRDRLPLIRFNIETKFDKNPGHEAIELSARLTTQAIEDAGMADRSTLQSFVPEVLPLIRREHPEIQTSLLVAYQPDIAGEKRIRQAFDLNVDILSPDYRYVDGDFVRRCHRKRLRVWVWVINETAEMHRLLGEGVDGIISDYPDRLRRAYETWHIQSGHMDRMTE